MASNAVTTAVVVDCPTPLAPPVVVNPQLQPITDTKAPNTTALIIALHKSQNSRKLRTESRKRNWEIPYKLWEIAKPPMIPVIKKRTVKMGNIKQQARTRGRTR